MKTASFLPFALALFSLSVIPACGGSVNPDDGKDASPDGGGSDVGGDVSPDGGGSDTSIDAPVDSPVGRIPKEHRPAAVPCAPSKGGGGDICNRDAGGPGGCKVDGDCTAGKNGHCALSGGGVFMCSCSYDTCANDAECGGKVCACQGTPYESLANNCTASGNCKVDGDCGPSGYCSPSGGVGCSGSIGGYFCHSKDDECVDTDDCKSATSGPAMCQYDSTKKHWACMPQLLCA